MKNSRPVHDNEVGIIHFNPETGRVEADGGAIIYVDLTALEQDEYINRNIPLTLKLFFKSVSGFFDGKLKIIDFEFPSEKAITISNPVKHVVVSREELENYLKEDTESDMILLSKSDKSFHGIRQYNIQLDRKILLGDESDNVESGSMDNFNSNTYFTSQIAKQNR